MAYYPEPVARLIEALQRLPGIGPKTAQRLSFFLLKRPVDEVAALAESLTQLKALIIHCSVCFNVTQEDPCRICRDPQRDVRSLCIVEEPNDLLALEKTGGFRGRYHVLLGALSPLDGIGPEDLKVRELLSRLEAASVEEIILATNPSVEGEATAIYLAKLLKPFAPKITRLARGLARGRRPRVRRRSDPRQGPRGPAGHVMEWQEGGRSEIAPRHGIDKGLLRARPGVPR